MKYHIKQNQWGNWNGYEGSRRVEEFGVNSVAAASWLTDKRIEADEHIRPVVAKLRTTSTALFESLKSLEIALESGDATLIHHCRERSRNLLNLVCNP